MRWRIEFHPQFGGEVIELSEAVQDRLLVKIELLSEFGPRLGRPHVDTLHGSQYSNMKELRFRADGGAWCVAFAFDSQRQAILLVAGDKSGNSESHFYRRLIDKADERFAEHLAGRKGDL